MGVWSYVRDRNGGGSCRQSELGYGGGTVQWRGCSGVVMCLSAERWTERLASRGDARP